MCECSGTWRSRFYLLRRTCLRRRSKWRRLPCSCQHTLRATGNGYAPYVTCAPRSGAQPRRPDSVDTRLLPNRSHLDYATNFPVRFQTAPWPNLAQQPATNTGPRAVLFVPGECIFPCGRLKKITDLSLSSASHTYGTLLHTLLSTIPHPHPQH